MRKYVAWPTQLLVVVQIVLGLAFGEARAEAATTALSAAQDNNLPSVQSLVWHAVARGQAADALARYRQIGPAGGWPFVPDGPSLHENDVDPRVVALRRRLILSGDLPAIAASADPSVFDRRMTDAVKRFQSRHGLVIDGIVGRETRAALNVPAAARAAQLSINLARLERLAVELPATGIVVNIPAATLQLDIDSRTVLLSRAVVGSRAWPTPLVAGTIFEIEINPYWNVPPRIARLEILPQIANDPDYFARHDMRVLNSEGNDVTDVRIDWSRFLEFGYRLRQDPGPDNPMGALKFVFPNQHAVFVHDTPTKASFAKSTRALSHGCVRLEQPHALASQLLADENADIVAVLDAAIASGATQRIALKRPMPIRTVYVTAWVGPDGAVQFRPDFYGYDADERTADAAKVAACSDQSPLPAG